MRTPSADPSSTRQTGDRVVQLTAMHELEDVETVIENTEQKAPGAAHPDGEDLVRAAHVFHAAPGPLVAAREVRALPQGARGD